MNISEELKEKLKTDIVRFTYTKKNGELREAIGTTNLEAIDNEDCTPKGTGKKPDGVIAYWDFDKEAWRSCREDSVVEIIETWKQQEK